MLLIGWDTFAVYGDGLTKSVEVCRDANGREPLVCRKYTREIINQNSLELYTAHRNVDDTAATHGEGSAPTEIDKFLLVETSNLSAERRQLFADATVRVSTSFQLR